jgi:hypothetical protein
MKKNLRYAAFMLSLGMIALPGATNAAERSQADALQLALSFNKENASSKRMANMQSMKMVYSLPANLGNTLYVFTPNDGIGFTIVSGNDAIAPILGYSENGIFSADEIPSNVAFWMSMCQELTNEAIADNLPQYTPAKTAFTRKENIAPIMTTIWDQDAPFWNLCPSKKYTGCVATAMAQIMKVFNWPEKSHGSAVWNNKTITLDRTYDWDNMIDDYTGSYTTAQGTAVAELMVDCGKSVNMQYSTSGSGAETSDVPYAMINNFDYDAGMVYMQRNHFTEEMWDDLMYYELQNGRPIMYGGFDTGYDGGHQFVAHGYQYKSNTAYYYINWGWSGYCDGYYKLSNLAPSGSGSGGNNGSYHTGADAVINIKPQTENPFRDYQIFCNGNFALKSSDGDVLTFKVTSGSLWGSTANNFQVLGGNDISATLGARLINIDDPENSYFLETCTTNARTNWVRWSSTATEYAIDVTEIPDGNYYIFPMSKAAETGKWSRVKAPYNKQQYLKLIRSNGANTISAPGTSSSQYIPVQYIIQEEYEYTITEDETVELNPMVLPREAENTALKFYSADPNIAVVSEDGVISAVSTGDTVITMEAADGSGITLDVTVHANAGSGVIGIDNNLSSAYDVFNLAGIRVATDATDADINNLPKGIYIANGKKFVVK